MANRWAEPLPENSHLYLVIAPDVSNSNRLSVRAEHLENTKPAFASGVLVNAGATLAADPGLDQAVEMTGSWLLVRGSTAEEVREKVLDDVYVKKGAWDAHRIQVTPVLSAKP